MDELHFRQEILTHFFKYVQSTESFFVVGGASMGKTRLLDFLMKEDVQKHYLREESGRTWLIRVDMNRLSIKNEPWAFYELLLSSVVLALSNHPDKNNIRAELIDLDARVIQGQDLLLALRFFEMAVNRLCQGLGLKLCFMFDEFDEVYKSLPRETFSQLRAVRDANKSSVSYAVFLRNLPERLRPTRDNESFYELLSRNMLGLGPYSKIDTLQILQKLESRRGYPLTPALRDLLYEASGGHIGLIQAFLGILIEHPEDGQRIGSPGWIEWMGKKPASIEECRKLWEGLDQDERDSLLAFAAGDQNRASTAARNFLISKGIIQQKDNRFFSPVFAQYVQALG
jgi:hypothetical protein